MRPDLTLRMCCHWQGEEAWKTVRALGKCGTHLDRDVAEAAVGSERAVEGGTREIERGGRKGVPGQDDEGEDNLQRIVKCLWVLSQGRQIMSIR